MRQIDITTLYAIGLTRLYKIWTDATPDKKFPGGLSRVRAGKKLVEEVKLLQTRIQQHRDKISLLKSTDEKLAEELKTLTNKIQTKQQQVKLLSDKYMETEKSISMGKSQHENSPRNKKKSTRKLKCKKIIPQQRESIAVDIKIYNENNATLEKK